MRVEAEQRAKDAVVKEPSMSVAGHEPATPVAGSGSAHSEPIGPSTVTSADEQVVPPLLLPVIQPRRTGRRPSPLVIGSSTTG